jgi:hypothetical protein
MAKKPKAYKRSKRKEQILLQMRLWHETGYATEATSYRLAKALELEPSPHFRNILNEMVLEGDLTCVERDQSGRYTTRFYSLSQPREHYHEKSLRRKITVSKRGVAVGQLEMFS